MGIDLIHVDSGYADFAPSFERLRNEEVQAIMIEHLVPVRTAAAPKSVRSPRQATGRLPARSTSWSTTAA